MSLFNTKDGELFTGVFADMGKSVAITLINKAAKGTPQYEEWLRKYREKRGKKVDSDEAKKVLEKKTESINDPDRGIYSWASREDYVKPGYEIMSEYGDFSPEAEEARISKLSESERTESNIKDIREYYTLSRRKLLAPKVAERNFSDKSKYLEALRTAGNKDISSTVTSIGELPSSEFLNSELGIPVKEAEELANTINENIGELEADEFDYDNTGEEKYGDYVSLSISENPKNESSIKLKNGAYLNYSKENW